MNLTLMRHGEPERAPIDPRNPGLSARGRAQARQAALYLGAEIHGEVYSSPQLRSVETARIATAGRGGSVVIEDGLVEFDHGSEYVHYDVSDPMWRQYLAGDLSPWGLSAAAFHARILSAIEAIARRHPADHVLAVCHGGVINAWTCRVLGVPERIRVFEPQYAALNRYSYVAGRWRLVSLNETTAPPSTRK